MNHAGSKNKEQTINKKNDKNNNDFACATEVGDANIFELDAKYFDIIGGGAMAGVVGSVPIG